MADITLNAMLPLGGYTADIGACSLRERGDLALVSIATPTTGGEALANSLKSLWDIDLPDPATSTVSGDKRLLPMTPDQMMLLFPATAELSESTVSNALSDVAYTTLQTDAWVILELYGQGTRDALERICPLDLELGVFPVNACSRTSMDHLGAVILRTDEDRFLLLSARSSAQSFLHAIETSCRWTAP